jgi:hypothetical protein
MRALVVVNGVLLATLAIGSMVQASAASVLVVPVVIGRVLVAAGGISATIAFIITVDLIATVNLIAFTTVITVIAVGSFVAVAFVAVAFVAVAAFVATVAVIAVAVTFTATIVIVDPPIWARAAKLAIGGRVAVVATTPKVISVASVHE